MLVEGSPKTFLYILVLYAITILYLLLLLVISN